MNKFIKEELPIIWFLTGHNLRIAFCALPVILIGMTIMKLFLEHMITQDVSYSLGLINFFVGNDFYNYITQHTTPHFLTRSRNRLLHSD